LWSVERPVQLIAEYESEGSQLNIPQSKFSNKECKVFLIAIVSFILMWVCLFSGLFIPAFIFLIIMIGAAQ